MVIELFYGFKRVDLRDSLVVTDSDDTWEPESVAACVTIAFLDSVEGDFEHDRWLDKTEPAVILNRVLFEELSHLRDLDVCQSRIRLSNIE